MNTDALQKDLAGLKKDLRKVSDDISAGYKELADLDRKRELARMDLKNIQTMNDPLVSNYDLRITQKKKELVLLEADITSAVHTKEEMDEAMAERLLTGQQAIDNARKVENSIGESIKNLRHREESISQNISNLKLKQDTESSALSLLQESVVSSKKEYARLSALVAEKQKTRADQEILEKKEQELNAGRDYLTEWDKEAAARQHDLNVMQGRLKPSYLAAFARINSRFINENSYTKRARLQTES